MNESILKSLMRLFAIVADVKADGNFGNKRDIVIDYLDRQYSHELVDKYIQYFDDQVRLFHPEAMYVNDDATAHQHNMNEEKIQEICEKINVELEMEQKMIVLVYLLDFINRGEAITLKEHKFVFKVAIYLKINIDEFKDLRAFTFGEFAKIIHKDNILFIDSYPTPEFADIKQMYNSKMEGRIAVIHFTNTNTYVFRYDGNLTFYLNGHYVKPQRSYIWVVGAVIKNPKVGSLYYTRVAGRFIQANIESKFVYTAEDIEFRYGNSTNGIRRFTLNEESGRFIGIIGGSGSGKSTLLNVLCGNIKPRNGSIKVNGYDIHQYKEELKGVIGFVPQDDLLIKELTVYQNLYYNAKLCFNDYNEEEINRVVELALVDFDLVEARDLNVGDAFTTILSGGQRKRLNLALELIREPSILFVDEPTSGLSSADSEKVINLLKKQTFKGNMIVANIHQPSSDVFKMFDKLLVVDQGGRIIYYGNPVDGITYFKRIAHFADAEESECLSCGNINPDQILRTIEARVVDANGRLTRKRKTTPEEWYQLYLKNIDPEIRQIHREHDSSIPKNAFKIPGHLKQFAIFLKRDVLAKIKNEQYLLLTAIEAPLLALILAFFTKRFVFADGIAQYIFGENTNIPAFLFMAVIVSIFLGSIISAEEIFKDRNILKREKFLNLSRSSYLFSKVAIMFAISAIQMFLFVWIGNHVLHIEGMDWRYWVILFTASCWANMVGLNISAGLNSVVTIYILIPLILVPQLLFSGVVVDFDKMHNKIASDMEVPVIGEFMASRWAYEALAVTQFKDNPYEKHFFQYEQLQKYANYYQSYVIPKLHDLIDEAEAHKASNADSSLVLNNMTVVCNEVKAISLLLGSSLPENTVPSIHPDDKQIADIRLFLDNSNKRFLVWYQYSTTKRDSVVKALVRKLGSVEGVLKLKQQYFNKQLAFVVTNEKELYDFSIQNGKILPTKDAVYRYPQSMHGRAHYYAPVKRVGKWLIDTFWFNVAFLWLFSGLLMVVLYFDVLKRIIAYFETYRLNRINRRRFMRLLKVSDSFEKGR